MTERYQLFESVGGDRTYPADDYSRQLYNLARDGYVNAKDNELLVTENTTPDLSVLVSTGAAWVQGRYYELYTSAKNLSISSNSTGDPRIDRIVVRLDTSANSVTAEVLQGTAAASPSPPSLTRNSTTWELSLAQVYVASGASSITNSEITDERSDTTLCGISVHSNLGGLYEGDYLKTTYNESGLSRLQNKITGLTVDYDTGDWLNSSGAADTITVDKDGIYLIQCRLYLDPNTFFGDKHEGRLSFYKNGSSLEYWEQLLELDKVSPDYEDIREYDQTIGATTIYYLQAGDTLSFYSYYDALDSVSGDNFDDTYTATANIEIYHLLETTL